MIRCQYHRWVMARCLDDAAALPARTQKHVAACPSCRARFEGERQCVVRLEVEAEAATARLTAPPYLRQRVIANLESWGRRPAPAPVMRGWTAALSAAAVVLAFGLVVWPRPHSSPVAGGSPALEALATLELIPDGTTMLEMGSRLDEPLQGEWDSVMLDARNALAALSRSFVPVEPERR